MSYAISIVLIVIAIISLREGFKNRDKKWKTPQTFFLLSWRDILNNKVHFYEVLNSSDKAIFEYKLHEFLLNVEVIGKGVDVTEEDRVLVGASAVIPVFRINNWRYLNLNEVILFPDRFNFDLEISGENRNVLGLVGNGHLEDKMILSKKALHLGFDNRTDKKNTAVHEFIHLIDMIDGEVDGIPNVLMQEPNVLPWIELMEVKIQEIKSRKSDMNNYGATSPIEFFTVASEYFFERPKLMKRKHPDLYAMLEEMFNHPMHELGLKEK